MPPKKKNEVSHNLKDIFDAAIALANCLNIKCKKEEEQLKKNKYVIEKEKLVLNFVNEMKNIKELIPSKDYKGIAKEVRKMKRIWIGKGLDGLLERRETEAKLIESCA
jgi:uncharacterized membrane protein YgaE (UPF0421/DUF939 family)